jgi:hypothetical protein
MNNVSGASFTELRNEKISLEKWMDKLALELDEVNKELAKRFRCFRALCVGPEPSAGHSIIKRGAPK